MFFYESSIAGSSHGEIIHGHAGLEGLLLKATLD